jgi:hypothetical protein
MMRWDNWYILPVVAKIENDHVKITEQVLPVGKVGVGGEAVAVENNRRTRPARP